MITSLGVSKSHKRKNYVKIKKEPASNEFKNLYKDIELKYASELEENRKKLIKSIIICLITFTIGLLIYIFLDDIFNFSRRLGGRILAITLIPAIFYYTYKYKKYNETYVKNYKNSIIKNFVKYINHNLEYQPYGGKDLFYDYLEAKFQDNNYNNFITDDYIEGYNEDSTQMQICNITLENLNEKGEFLDIVYEGIFSITKLNIYLSDEIRIQKNKYIIKNNSNKVEMDSEEFEKYFDIYSNSDILAMQILTHDIMEELVEFYKKYKIEFELVLKNDHIYIRFNTGIMFEPNILKKSNDINTLWVYYNILQFVTNFTIKINKLLKDLDI